MLTDGLLQVLTSTPPQTISTPSQHHHKYTMSWLHPGSCVFVEATESPLMDVLLCLLLDNSRSTRASAALHLSSWLTEARSQKCWSTCVCNAVDVFPGECGCICANACPKTMRNGASQYIDTACVVCFGKRYVQGSASACRLQAYDVLDKMAPANLNTCTLFQVYSALVMCARNADAETR